MKSFHSHTVSRAKTPASHSDSHHPSLPTNGRGREAILESITVHYRLSVSGSFYFITACSYELADAFILCWWSTFMPQVQTYGRFSQLLTSYVFYVQKVECGGTKNERLDGERWRKRCHVFRCVSSGFSFASSLSSYVTAQTSGRKEELSGHLGKKCRHCLFIIGPRGMLTIDELLKFSSKNSNIFRFKLL